MSLLDALLAGVREAPAEDLPRLALADWLEENGREADRDRAALIRVQCTLARLPSVHPDQPALMQEERVLQTKLVGWLECLRTPLALPWRSPSTFERGLLRLDFRGLPDLARTLDTLAQTPPWPWVTGMELVDLTRGGFQSLTRSPQLVGLTTLTLGSTAFDNVEFRNGSEPASWLAQTDQLPYLFELHLGTAGLSDEGVALLGGARGLNRLARLHLNWTGVSPAGVRGLLQGSGLPALHGLTLVGLKPGALDMRTLARLPVMARLRQLDINAVPMRPEGAQALAESAHTANLERLALVGCRLDNAGAVVLAGACGLPKLTYLNLSANGIGPAGARALAGSALLSRLEHLDLSRNHVGDTGAIALAESPHAARLAYLGLSNNGLGDEAKEVVGRRFEGRVQL